MIEEVPSVIKITGLDKKFSRNLRRSMIYGMVDTLKSFFGIRPNTTELRRDEFWALKDINFELKKGEILGIIGSNGSGKSTLLRVLTGIFPPDNGSVEIDGSVGGIIALGAGMHAHMTGRENIYLNGTILGMTRAEIDGKFNEIVNFAELGDFLDAPFSSYSSGMKVRLGFAVAIHGEPDILLVDEVLAVGDMNFRQKSMRKMSQVLDSGKSVIFISHSSDQVLQICSRVILLSNGKIIKEGAPTDVVYYYNEISSKHEFDQPTVIGDRVRLKSIVVHEGDNVQVDRICVGDRVHFDISLELDETIRDVNVIFGFGCSPQNTSFYPLDFKDGKGVEQLSNGTRLKLVIEEMYLPQGTYKLMLGIWGDNGYCYYWNYTDAGHFYLENKKKMYSEFMLKHDWLVDSSN